MFCFQCEQTMRSETGAAGCGGPKGVCGKDEATADLQDVLIHQLKGIGQYVTRLQALGRRDAEADSFILYALFTTLTNVNFNRARFVEMIATAARMRDRLRDAYAEAASGAGQTPEALGGAAAFIPADSLVGLLAQANVASVRAGAEAVGEDVIGMRALLLYGLKGVAAYAHHAEVLGETREAIADGVARVLDLLAGDPVDLELMLEEALALGRVNFTVMEALDAANTGTYGAPTPTPVRITPVEGKAILVSGHDLRDLHAILEATRDTGINVYTHGEMLPAHGYPVLKSFPHLKGNLGSSWIDQKTLFADFPGALLVTTNCVLVPTEAYRDRLFTSGPAVVPGATHVEGYDFSALIEKALALPVAEEKPGKVTLTTGFSDTNVLPLAGKIIEAVKAGKIKHFFLVGGCDAPGRGGSYFREFVQKTPSDTVILTLACGKFRFNDLDLGAIDGIPRLIDLGQCNDAISAVNIALALAGAFGCGVNDLPLTLVLSWTEQKAVAILMGLFSLGIKGIYLGPKAPAWITPAVFKVLQDNFDLRLTGTPDEDLTTILGRR